jgi:hypothetical protein
MQENLRLFQINLSKKCAERILLAQNYQGHFSAEEIFVQPLQGGFVRREEAV